MYWFQQYKNLNFWEFCNRKQAFQNRVAQLPQVILREAENWTARIINGIFLNMPLILDIGQNAFNLSQAEQTQLKQSQRSCSSCKGMEPID